MLYCIIKALPRIYMENTARVGMLKDKYSMRQSRVLYLSRDIPPSSVFSIQRAKVML